MHNIVDIGDNSRDRRQPIDGADADLVTRLMGAIGSHVAADRGRERQLDSVLRMLADVDNAERVRLELWVGGAGF